MHKIALLLIFVLNLSFSAYASNIFYNAAYSNTESESNNSSKSKLVSVSSIKDIKNIDFSYYTQKNITFDEYRVTGIYFFKQKDYQNAIINLKNALALKPNDTITKSWLEAAINAKKAQYIEELTRMIKEKENKSQNIPMNLEPPSIPK